MSDDFDETNPKSYKRGRPPKTKGRYYKENQSRRGGSPRNWRGYLAQYEKKQVSVCSDCNAPLPPNWIYNKSGEPRRNHATNDRHCEECMRQGSFWLKLCETCLDYHNDYHANNNNNNNVLDNTMVSYGKIRASGHELSKQRTLERTFLQTCTFLLQEWSHSKHVFNERDWVAEGGGIQRLIKTLAQVNRQLRDLIKPLLFRVYKQISSLMRVIQVDYNNVLRSWQRIIDMEQPHATRVVIEYWRNPKVPSCVDAKTVHARRSRDDPKFYPIDFNDIDRCLMEYRSSSC